MAVLYRVRPDLQIALLWYIARRHLRRNLASAAGLALLVAVTSGAVMALVAGADRTEAAFPTFVAHAEAGADAVVFAQLDENIPFEADDQSALMPLLAGIAAVDDARRATFVILEGTSASGIEQRLLGVLAIDGAREQVLGRPMVVDGEWPAPSEPNAIAIDEELAARAQLGVGDTYQVAPFTVAQFGPAGEGADLEPAGPVIEMRVDAIYRYPEDLRETDLDQDGIYVDTSNLELTPAFWTTYGPDLARYGVGATVELSAGSDLAELEAALQALIPDRFTLEVGGPIGSTPDVLQGIERAIELQAQGMRLVAMATGLAGAGLLWLLLGRRRTDVEPRDAVLSGLGLAGRDRTALHACEGAVIALVGASAGALIAVVTSAAMPFGLAGRAELRPGIDVDGAILAVVWLSTVLIVVASTSFGRHRSVRSARSPNRLSTAAGRLGPVAAVGIRAALQPDGRGRGVPVRTAMAGVAVATAVVVGVAVAGASLDLVRDDPVRRGAYGDAVVGNLASSEAAEVAASVLDGNPDIVAYTGETTNFLAFGSELLLVSAYFEGAGALRPVVIDGRVPIGDDEIALGAVAMERLGVGIGDTVETTMSGQPIALEVVGTAVVDDVGGLMGGPGKGGLIAESALRRLDPLGLDTTGPTWFVVRFSPHVDHAAALDRLSSDFPRAVVTPRLPADLQNVERLGGLAVLLAVLLAAIGTGTALFALLSALSSRRADLAILRTLGFVRLQAAGTVVWQASVFAVVGLLAGLPLGLVAGRLVWRAVADGVGIEPDPVVPPTAIVAVIAATLVLLNAVALVPAFRAGRLRPSEILRAE